MSTTYYSDLKEMFMTENERHRRSVEDHTEQMIPAMLVIIDAELRRLF